MAVITGEKYPIEKHYKEPAMKQSTAFLYEFLSYAFDGIDRELIKDMIDNALNRLTETQQQAIESNFNEEGIKEAYGKITELEAKIKNLEVENEGLKHLIENLEKEVRDVRWKLDDVAAQRDAQQKDISKAREVCPFAFTSVTQLAERAVTQYDNIMSLRGRIATGDGDTTVFDMTEHGPRPHIFIPGQRVLVNNDEFIGTVLASPVGDPRDTVRVRSPDGVVPRYDVKNVKPLPNGEL